MNQTTFLNIPRIGWCWNGLKVRVNSCNQFLRCAPICGVVVTFWIFKPLFGLSLKSMTWLVLEYWHKSIQKIGNQNQAASIIIEMSESTIYVCIIILYVCVRVCMCVSKRENRGREKRVANRVPNESRLPFIFFLLNVCCFQNESLQTFEIQFILTNHLLN